MSADRIPLPRTAGALWVCSLRDVAPDPEAMLAWTEASTIVCLNRRDELEARFPTYVDWLRAHQPGRALWFPIRNYRARGADEVLPLVRVIDERLEQGEGVVVHCAMGQGRAGTMAVCILMSLGADLHDALRTVAAHRAFAGPAEASQWALVEEVAERVGRADP